METYRVKQKTARKTGAIVLFLLIGYVSISYFVGFPLGFGKIISQQAAKSYCGKIYPEAQVGKTVFNPVEKGDTWRSMTVARNNNAPRTKEMFYAAELVEK